MDWDKKTKSDRKWNIIGKKLLNASARYQRFKERLTPTFIKKFQKYMNKKLNKLYRALNKFMQKYVIILSVKQWIWIQVVFYFYHFILRILIRVLLTNADNIDTFGEHPLATEIIILDIIPIILLILLAFSISDDDDDKDDKPTDEDDIVIKIRDNMGRS